MVPIRIGSSSENLYLDIHHVDIKVDGERMRLVVSAIIGDGWYEGEVAVALGGETCVTFADQYLDERRIADFFERFERQSLEQAIGVTVSSLIFSCGRSRGRRQVLAYRHEGCVLPLWPLAQSRQRRKTPKTITRAA